jgi:PhoPQ-activated pathogenicity-related protein
MDLARIAAETHSIVIDLQDVPNQYLTVDDNIPRKEDGLVAYTWNRYMDRPNETCWPLHVPMTKAVIKAMDAAQEIMQKKHIPQYIISASGDDFFVPDSLNLYLDKLPGEKLVRVVPNQPHYINMKIIEDAMLTYYKTIITNTLRPSLSWKLNTQGQLRKICTKKIKPASVKLWEAVNPDMKDFRLAAHILYHSKDLTGTCQNDFCQYPLEISPPEKGWKAYFVEVSFEGEHAEPLILTTPAYMIAA